GFESYSVRANPRFPSWIPMEIGIGSNPIARCFPFWQSLTNTIGDSDARRQGAAKRTWACPAFVFRSIVSSSEERVMSRRNVRWGLWLAILSATSPARAQQGAVRHVHDPVIIRENDAWYVFSTGAGIPVRCSRDLARWEQIGRVFTDDVPAWAHKEIPEARHVWAPDISYYGGRFHLYYSVSTLGSQRSCIGLATNTTLDPSSPEFAWIDHGKVIESFPGRMDFNAIDLNRVKKKLGRLQQTISLLRAAQQTQKTSYPEDQALSQELAEMKQQFQKALSNDFNTALAISHLNRYISRIQQHLQPTPRIGKQLANKILDTLQQIGTILFGDLYTQQVSNTPQADISPLVTFLLRERERLRQNKQFNQADSIRTALKKMGIEIADTATGPLWWHKPSV
ncbi:MAG: family 43 glycosylhydrolase, partial [Promethearchaeota archaeon]